MNKNLSAILKYVLGLGLGIGLLYLSLRGLDIGELQEKIRNANFYLIFLALIVALASHLFRAIRWKMMLKASDHDAPLTNTYASLMVGYMVNQAIPRGGEVARCTMLYKSDKVPVSTSIGTVVTERVFDLIILLLLIGFFTLMEFDKIMTFMSNFLGASKDAPEQTISPVIWIAGGLIVLGGIIVFAFRKKILDTAIGQRIVAFLKEMIKAAMSVTRLKKPWLFLFHTVMIWVCYGVMTALPVMALDTQGELGVNIWYFGFMLMTMGGLGMAMPAPGGIGPYHLSVIFTFAAFFGESMRGMGQTVAVVIHSSQMIMLVLSGFIGWVYLVLQNKSPEPAKNTQNDDSKNFIV